MENEVFNVLRDASGLLTANEVSRLLKCHGQSVYRWASTGRLRSLKINRWRRFEPAAVADFIRGATNDQ